MIDILPTLALCTNHLIFEKKLLRIWGLVLESQGVAHCFESGPSLMVSSTLAPKAVAEILAYEAENSTLSYSAPLPDNSWSSLLILAVFVMLNFWVEHWTLEAQEGVYQAGRLEAGLVVQGQWWRSVTALFLHADAGHLLSNVVALGILGPLLGRRLGFGLTWTLFLASGALGNTINAWVQAPTHLSIGASTGVFGLIGVLSGRVGRFSSGHRFSNILLSLGFALSFLAMLGAGEGRVDLGAHFFGLLSGLVFAVVVNQRWVQKLIQKPWSNVSAGMLCLVISLWSWIMALSA